MCLAAMGADVIASTDGLEMPRIDARLVLAEVVKIVLFGNRTAHTLKYHAMNRCRGVTSNVDPPIAPMEIARKVPAIGFWVDTEP